MMRYYILLLAVSFVTRLPSLFVRVIDADEAVYANAARGILKGSVLYRDVIDQKPPLIYYFYAFFLGIFDDLRFLHAVGIVVVWLTAIVVYRLVARCFDMHSGAVAGILYAAFVSTVGYSSNAEVFMNLPLVLGMWMFFSTFEESRQKAGVPPRRSFFVLLIAGVCLGIASLIKQQAVVAIVPLLLMTIVPQVRRKSGRCLGELLALIIGAALPFLLVLLYFWNLGIVNEFIYWTYIYNTRYIAPESAMLPVLTKAALVAVLPMLMLWWYSLKRIGDLWSEKGADHPAIVFGLLWLAASIYAVALGLRFYTHYFVQLLPPLVFLAAQPIAERFSSLRRMRIPLRLVFLSFLIAPAIAVSVTVGVKGLQGRFDSQRPGPVWAGEFIDSQTKIDDRIFVWGDALIGYLADRQISSRFMNAAFVFENRDPCFQADDEDVSKYVRTPEFDMLMSDLKRHLPRLIVDTSPSGIHCWQNYPIDKFMPLANFIKERYKNIGEYDGIKIYRLQ